MHFSLQQKSHALIERLFLSGLRVASLRGSFPFERLPRRLTRSVRNELSWALRYANLLFGCGHFRNKSARTKAPDVKTTIAIDRSFPNVPAMTLPASQTL